LNAPRSVRRSRPLANPSPERRPPRAVFRVGWNDVRVGVSHTTCGDAHDHRSSPALAVETEVGVFPPGRSGPTALHDPRDIPDAFAPCPIIACGNVETQGASTAASQAPVDRRKTGCRLACTCATCGTPSDRRDAPNERLRMHFDPLVHSASYRLTSSDRLGGRSSEPLLVPRPAATQAYRSYCRDGHMP
jgi:hypothetical protein